MLQWNMTEEQICITGRVKQPPRFNEFQNKICTDFRLCCDVRHNRNVIEREQSDKRKWQCSWCVSE